MNDSNLMLDGEAAAAEALSSLPEAGAWSVPLTVKSPGALSSAPQPITVGVPFPKGLLNDSAAVALIDPTGRKVPVQCEPLAHWSDGSVKWLLVDFLLPGDVAADSIFQLCELPVQRHGAPESPVAAVSQTAKEFVIEAGNLRYHIARERATPRLEIADAVGRKLASLRAVFTDKRGRVHEAVVTRSVVETVGPVRTTLYLEAVFRKCRGLRLNCRLSFFADSGLVCVRSTLHNPNRARHRGGLWDLGDPGSILFRDFSLLLDVPDRGSRVICRSEPDVQIREAADAQLEIYQDSSGGENWQSRNHANRDGRVPCQFRGYRERTSRGEHRGLRASPTLILENDRLRVDVALPEFWQQFPKRVATKSSEVRVGLWPLEWNDLHELQGGEQKTHTVWFRFGVAAKGEREFCQAGKPDLRWAESLDWAHAAAACLPDPRWTADTKALSLFLPADDDPEPRLQALLAHATDGERSLLARREVIDEYGWRNYGEVYADHENTYYTGFGPVVSHYNNQYDLVYGTLLQWLRTGVRAWLDLADPLARHVIDIDVYHTTRDRAAYSGGLFWHSDHYLDAGTATHRSYSRVNLEHRGAGYGGGASCEHNYTTGLLHYYYLTGNKDARRAVLELADWVVRMDDGRENILGLLDDGPTGLATSGDDFGNSVPGRGPANSINALLDAWLLSGDRRYLQLAEVFLRRVVHPRDDIAALDLLNVEDHWFYTVFLGVVSRYLEVKAEHDELDSAYAYAQACLLHYARWMVDNERPYFDHIEKLQFPTETWAAQEFRKANVLMTAAMHAEGPFRQTLLQRGRALADRAWADLLRFDTVHLARPLAIMMTEGLRDARFRARRTPPQYPRVAMSEIGPPTCFVPQKQRIKRRLTTAAGLAGAAYRLLAPTSYLRLFGLARRRFLPATHVPAPQ